MGLISRKENRVRQRREAAQHTTPMQGLPTEKRALSRRAKTQMYSKDRQRRKREENRGGTQKGMLTGNASGVFCGEKMLAGIEQEMASFIMHTPRQQNQLHQFFSKWPMALRQLK